MSKLDGITASQRGGTQTPIKAESNVDTRRAGWGTTGMLTLSALTVLLVAVEWQFFGGST